jgi:REP element-mobilizing transposase RayT
VLPERGVYHVTARGVDRCSIYLDGDDYGFFVSLFRLAARNERITVLAYCLMPNHYHGIFDGYRERISRTLHRVNGVYASHFNARHGRVGHLFQDRFHARVTRDDEHVATACTYVWNNPVRAGLCVEAHEWPWSGRL